VEEKLPAKRPKSEALIEVFQDHAVAARRIQEIAIKNTLPSDWVSFGGQAWLDTPGAERVARALGLTVKDWSWTREDHKDDEGPYFTILCHGKVGHAPSDMWVDAVGFQWSRKPFFWKEGERKKHVSEINPGNIIKDAYSDMFRNGVTRLLGLRGLPWDYLRELGITPEKAKKVDFETGKRGGKKPAKKASPEASEYAGEEQISLLCRTAANKVIMQTPEDIRKTLPEKLTREDLNKLLKYIATLPGEIELEEWVEKVKEVTSQ
jgi:hypothetical protein